MKYKVGLRINFDITNISPNDDDNFDSRFGFSVDSGDFEVALNKIKALKNIVLVGVHTHRHSQTRSLSFYKHITEVSAAIIKKYNLSLDYFDIGGGFFGPMPEKPTFEQYSNIIKETLPNSLKDICLIIEPGNALVASTFSYIASVIDVKQHNNKIYITTDGTRNDIDPTYHKTDYFKEIKYCNPSNLNATKPQIVCGMTCLENDRLFIIEANNKLLKEGDKILFRRVGAYTTTLTPLFIHFFPIIYCEDRFGNISVIRNEWSEEEIIAKSMY